MAVTNIWVFAKGAENKGVYCNFTFADGLVSFYGTPRPAGAICC